jgi:hypothetical protein
VNFGGERGARVAITLASRSLTRVPFLVSLAPPAPLERLLKHTVSLIVPASALAKSRDTVAG